MCFYTQIRKYQCLCQETSEYVHMYDIDLFPIVDADGDIMLNQFLFLVAVSERERVSIIFKSSQCLFGSYTQITTWPGTSQNQGKRNCRSPDIHKAYAVPDQFIGSRSGTVILSLSVLRIQKIITVNSITALLPQCSSPQHKHSLRISLTAYTTQPFTLHLSAF